MNIKLTLYPPKCLTWQVNVASLPIATEILTIPSANSGWNIETSGKLSRIKKNDRKFYINFTPDAEQRKWKMIWTWLLFNQQIKKKKHFKSSVIG